MSTFSFKVSRRVRKERRIIKEMIGLIAPTNCLETSLLFISFYSSFVIVSSFFMEDHGNMLIMKFFFGI